MFRSAFVAAALVAYFTASPAQISSFPHIESFDQSAAVPAGWTAVGWTISTTSARSSPNCISATGNSQARVLTSPPVEFGTRIPDRLTFYDRRTTTALRYRLALRAVGDVSGLVVPLAQWDSAATTNSYVERTVDLAAAQLDPEQDWRFVWEILRDSTNSTGVLRIDDVRILAASAVDLSPARIEVSPPQPRAGDAITITIVVRNAGRSDANPATLTVQWLNPLGGSGSSLFHPSVKALDSAYAFASFLAAQPGRIEIIAITDAASDETASNDTLRAVFSVGIPPSAVVVNEVQFAPLRENEPEWVELFNPGPWVIPLRDVTISDNSTSRIALTNRADEALSPGQFVVVARSEEFFLYYPDARSLLTLFPSLNNTTPDAVVLRDVHGRAIDSVAYQPGWTIAGRSMERRDWNLRSAESSTWGASESADGATPGRPNSILRPDIDVSCERLEAAVHPGTISLHLTAVVRNRGRLAVGGGSVDWHLHGPDSAAGTGVLLGSTMFSVLAPSESTLVEYRWSEEVLGELRLRGTVSAAGDARPSNDTSWGVLLRPYVERSVLVNEVMLEPAPGRAEWVEVVNVGDRAVDLSGWTIADHPSTSGSRVRTTLPADLTALVPGGMAVIASDASIVDDHPWLSDGEALVVIAPRSSGFGFNNDGDAIVLFDRTGAVIDSVVASRASHVGGLSSTGRSLERRSLAGPATDPSAWSSCADPVGATPGRINSVARRSESPAFSVRVEPDPFSPDGDAFEDVVEVRFQSSAVSLFVHAVVFDLSGRAVRRLADGLFVPASGALTWDGRNDGGRVVPIGVYIVFVSATDAVTGRRENARVLCSVAR